MKPNDTINSRGVAAEIVARWLRTADFPDRLMIAVAADRAFITEVVYGTVKRRRELDWVVKQCAHGRPEPALRACVLVGLYQLLHMTAIEPYAAVSETVEAAKCVAGVAGARFANAILRRVQREGKALGVALSAQSPGLRESHPDELVNRWVARYGEADTLALMRWDNGAADVVVRANTTRTSLVDLQRRFAEAGVGCLPHAFAPDKCLTVARGARVESLPGWLEGLFTVQDPSTVAAAELVGAQPGETVLDACAAPGGKLAVLAEQMQGQGRLVAMDLHENRLALLRSNLERLGLSNWVQVMQGDIGAAEGVALNALGPFDRILMDVPCTNTGVLRRRPDARWRFSTTRLATMVELQARLLDGAARLLRPGGMIVYSTCSLEPEEGEERVRAWLASQPLFELTAERRLFPPRDGTDGAYAAALGQKG